MNKNPNVSINTDTIASVKANAVSKSSIVRKKTRKIMIGNVAVGGDSPISVQSMTNTLTSDVQATVQQILKMEQVGADIVRCSCPDYASAIALKDIVKFVHIPVVADIHFDYKMALLAADNGVACLRINPGNIGGRDRVAEVVKAAKANNIAIRIGINGGSLEKGLLEKYKEPCADAIVESALNQAKMLEDNDFFNFKISVKSSDVLTTIASYRKLSGLCDYPLHIGITEAGGLRTGLIKSGIGIGTLLMDGIGDTLRVSLSADVTEEVKAGFELLKALDLRHRGIRIVSCPTCARKGFEVEQVVNALDDRLSHISQSLNVAVMGCVVNGPGEAANADVAMAGGGKGIVLVYIGGEPVLKVSAENAVDFMVNLVQEAVSMKEVTDDWQGILQEKYKNKSN